MLSRFRRTGWLVFAVMLGQASSGLAAEISPSGVGHVWGFETTVDDWQARAKSIGVSRVEGRSATPESHASLRVQGRIEAGWNYALSGHVPLAGGRLYRLTSWLRVDQLGTSTPAPFLKCEFIGPTTNRYLGQVTSPHYDTARLGAWQRLGVEFQAPVAAQECWLALEKGADGPAEIDARLDDICLESISKLSTLEKYRLKPLPASLEKMRGLHPRMYLDAARVSELRAAIQGTHATLWQEVREQADRLARRDPPAYRENDGSSGDDQLWQREVGNAMPVLAMA